MSDSIKQLSKEYEENVAERPRRVGLYTIPEYPEYEVERGMWSTAFDAILTTLRYLAPATLLTLLWGQQSFIFKLLKYIDSAFRALLFSNEEQKQAVLQWLSEYGSVRVEDLDTVWRHGWILCGVVDAALPGACAGHPPTNLSLKHAQAIADHYLGVEPVFTRQELESNDILSKHQEWRLTTYINCVRQAVSKVTPPAIKPSLQKTSSENTQYILDYIARGSGLTAAQINHPMYFKIYPTSQQSLDPGDITIVIKGPDDTYGMRVLPPILGKAQLIRQQLLGVRSQSAFTENSLPLAHGTTYFRNYGKNDMSKTFHIPKTNYSIEIEVESAQDHVKVGYTANLEGKYEVFITSKGQNIVGSPYSITASKNIINLLEKESFSLEDGEEIDIVDVKSDRKVVVRIVDFVTEKMLLKENGVLQKITDDEAKYLMENDIQMEKSLNVDNEIFNNITAIRTVDTNKKSIKFNEAANKVIKINKVCKLFYDIMNEKEVFEKEDNHQLRNQQDIPDVVNSTLGEATASSYMLSNKRDKFIVPENISVSILTEKVELSNTSNDSKTEGTMINKDTQRDDINLVELKLLRDVSFDETDSQDTTQSSSNPFLSESFFQDDKIEKILGTFVTSEYETNKLQNEETQDTLIKITVDRSSESPPIDKSNPFIDIDTLNAARPKSPLFKIIANEDECDIRSIYSDLNSYESTNENEFVNPFFTHQHLPSNNDKQSLPVADFIIGAPVSLPPEIKSLSQETNSDSLDIANKTSNNKTKAKQEGEIIKILPNVECSSSEINFRKNESTYPSVNSNTVDSINDGSMSPKKEMRDSAYVSIDENNTLPDSNNNDNNILKDSDTKQKYFNSHYLSNMGPAEREIWENCTELRETESNKLHDEIIKMNRWDLKKSNCTPIVEENDKSLGMKGMKIESEIHTETDPVTLAFAEINVLYNDYFPNSEKSSTTNEDQKNVDREIEQMSEYEYVKSASEDESDVMRHRKQSEGKISEIQSHVTESVSVSQTLHVNLTKNYKYELNNDQTKFGDATYSNIVLEKKKYWDEKIRLIEANAEESRAQQRKRRLSAKQLRHNDSLSKRKGKQIIKKYLSTNDKQNIGTENQQVDVINLNYSSLQSNEDDKINLKRVKNWKTFWDNKLESENNEINISNARINSPKPFPYSIASTESKNDTKIDSKTQVNITQTSPHVKQEIPEEVFKAFETSPKRFFGTSRKQILNKIDTFSGKPNTVKEPLTDNIETTYESGLVSSRISLFHNISHSSESTWTQRKSQSMHNIYHQKDSQNEANNTLNFGKSSFNIKTDEKMNIPENINKDNFEQKTEVLHNITLKEKRARMTDKLYTKSFDESSYHRSIEDDFSDNDINIPNRPLSHCANNGPDNVHKITSSKSEMDIFNKFANKPTDEDFDKYKSCDELPKVSVKRFISLYEDVSKNSETSSPRSCNSKSPGGSEKQFKPVCLFPGTAITNESIEYCKNLQDVALTKNDNDETEEPLIVKENSKESPAPEKTDAVWYSTIANKETSNHDVEKESTYISLSDIDLEIVDKLSDKSIELSHEKELENSSTDYKSRFKLAKQYFQSLEELREIKKPKKLNECELLLYNKSNESLIENDRSKPIKTKIKSHTMPSSEISEFWNQLQDQQNETKDTKLIKISEKFHVEDLFSDVMEGRLSRQGSLRGIPHKKAVLEAFRSMENISDNKLSPYELAVSQFAEVNDESRIKNAQTYLSEYPYLPTTDPSKFHSRLDANASGLISFKELLSKRVRRNSVPDLRLNPTFTVEL